jgi:hypothetical protein
MYTIFFWVSNPLCLSVSSAIFSDYSFQVHHLVLTRMTGCSLHMQWPLTSQLHGSVSQREQLVFSLRIKLHALIRLGVSPPSFDTGARNGVLCGSWQSHLSLKKIGLAEVWTRVSQMTHHRSIHYSTSSCSYVHNYHVGNYVRENCMQICKYANGRYWLLPTATSISYQPFLIKCFLFLFFSLPLEKIGTAFPCRL